MWLNWTINNLTNKINDREVIFKGIEQSLGSKMKKIFLGILISLASILSANDLQCHDIYTTMTFQKGQDSYVSEGTKGSGNTKITISFRDEKVFLINGADKQELFVLSKGIGSFYLLEKTPVGNFNLLSLFDDGTLTISKSYNAFGMAKLNVQSIYKCN